jgi:hypothetical protein
MASKGQSGLKSVDVDPCQVRSTALGAFERTHGRTQEAMVERQAQSTRISCRNPSRPWQLFAVNGMPYVRPQITGAFERTTCVRM